MTAEDKTQTTQAADALMAVFGFKRVTQDKPSDAPLPVPDEDEHQARCYTKSEK